MYASKLRTLLYLAALYPALLWAALPAEISRFLNIPQTPYNYTQIEFPAHFLVALNTLDNTPFSPSRSDAIVTLGRVLFYEKQLSQNSTISCASCHAQALGFSDSSRFSSGFEGKLTERNSMGLANARFYENGHFFWDERADTLAAQTLEPIQNSIEMGLTLTQAVNRVSAQSYSDYLFDQAFGSSSVTSNRIATASLRLAQQVADQFLSLGEKPSDYHNR